MKAITHRLLFILFALVAFCAQPVIQPAFASPLERPAHQVENPQFACHPLDVVFLIDQSDSMSGANQFYPSDPTEQRKYAVEAVIDLLTDIAIDQCPDVTNRIGVISYGADAVVDLPLSNISPNSAEEGMKVREALKQKVSAREMGQTNPQAAFELAKEMFDDAEKPRDTGLRKQAIIFVTDGIPYPTPNMHLYAQDMQRWIKYNFPFDANLLTSEDCLRELRLNSQDGKLPGDQVNACLEKNQDSSAYSRSTYVWMILLEAHETYPLVLQQTYEQVTRDHAGELIQLSENRKDVPSTFRRIISDMAGVHAELLQCGNFAVNPYLKKAKLNIYKLDPELQVTLSFTDVAGNKHEITAGQAGVNGGFDLEEYYEFGANERYVFHTPYPGLWSLQADNCDGLDAYYEEDSLQSGETSFNLPAEIGQFDRQPFYDENHPVFIEYQMVNDAGETVAQADHEQFQVAITTTVTQPGGEQILYEMAWQPGEKLFRSKEPLKVPTTGVYKIDMVGSILEHKGSPGPLTTNSFAEVFNTPRLLFEHHGAEVLVTPVTPFDFEVITPTSGQILKPIHGNILNGWPLPVRPVELIVRITVPSRPETDIKEVLKNPDGAFQAILSTEDGQNQTITLSPNPDVPGEYTGQFAQIASPGKYKAALSLTSSYDEAYRPLHPQQIVEFFREDGLWTRESTYLRLLYIIVALLVVFIIRFFSIRTNPVKGFLIFSSGGEEFARLPLKTSKNTKEFGSGRLSNLRELGLKRIRVRNISKVQRKKQKNDLLVDQMDEYMMSGHGVRVEFTPQKGKRFSRDLYEGVPGDVDSAGTFQVHYQRQASSESVLVS